MNFMSIRLDHRITLVVPRSYRTHPYGAFKGHKSPYFVQNRSFLPDIAWVGHIDPYNKLYKYQVVSSIPLGVQRPYKTQLYRAYII